MDGAAYFHSKEVMGWATQHKVQFLRVPPHHHRGNGSVERYIRNLIARIRYLLFEHHGSWTDHVQKVADQTREMVHKSIGKTPKEIM